MDGVPFVVHKHLVADQSEALEAMMGNGMKECKEGRAPLKYIDKSTFARFVEFIYTGDYNPAEPSEPPPAPPEDSNASGDDVAQPTAAAEVDAQSDIPDAFEVPPPMSDITWDDWDQSSKRSKTKVRKLDDGFSDRPITEAQKPKLPISTLEVVIEQPLPTSSTFVPNRSWSLDFLPVFLSHAQVYVFADVYGVTNLQRLAARRLDEALSAFSHSPDSPTSITQLIQYIYDHTPARKENVDVLQTIVTNFAANNIETLGDSSDFRNLIRDGGSFAVSLMCKMRDRIAT